MEKVQTIRQHNNVNHVYREGMRDSGGAGTQYRICFGDDPKSRESVVKFKCGAIFNGDAEPGVMDVDLLEIVRDRLNSYQRGPRVSQLNAGALLHVEYAIDYLNKIFDEGIKHR